MGEIIKIKTIKFEKVLFFAILFIAIIVRLYGWPTSLKELNCDEAMTAINARTISENGVDMYGTSFPVFFESWKYGGQSAALEYIMALSIKIFGTNIFAVRLPLMFFSLVSLIVIYDFSKRIFNNRKLSLIILAMLAINPWQILQSIWSLDCNLFPHFMLIATYSLYIAVTENKKWLLYISAGLFGLTMYTYGVSIYFIPFFLLITTIYLVKNKKINFKELILMALVYLLISFPFYLMILVNAFKLNDIHIFGITIQYFKQFIRTNDMLIYSSDFFYTFGKNLRSLFNVIFIGDDGYLWNCIKLFGPIYHLSLIFLIWGMYRLIRKIYNKKETENLNNKTRIGIFLIICWLLTSLLLGVFINNVNINRLNIIWYPIIFISGYGFYEVWRIVYNLKTGVIRVVPYIIILVYLIMFAYLSYLIYFVQVNLIGGTTFWSHGLVDAIRYADTINNETIYIIDEESYGRNATFLNYATNFDNGYIKNLKVTRNNDKKNIFDQRYHIETPNYVQSEFNAQKGVTYIVAKHLFNENNFEGFDIKKINLYYVISANK